MARMSRHAWLERIRVASMAQRILDVDRTLLHYGTGVLTAEEASVLRSLADRLEPALPAP
ncbi:MAG: hypothetical protein LC624_06610 [Halobacteriales archaeon]|nr:hypothetical protein [Halobacteriales archaeon]